MDARTAAAIVLGKITMGRRSTATTLPATLKLVDDPRERRFAQELVYGVLRWFFPLEKALTRYLKRPLRRKDGDLHALLLIGIYQLSYLRTPAHAAIAATVDTARSLGKPWAGALVNAILRAYQRQQEDQPSVGAPTLVSEPERFSHPQWLIDEIKRAWPEDWVCILEQNNRPAPLALRVNKRQTSRQAYLACLEQAGLQAKAAEFTTHGVVLRPPTPVENLPGFHQGMVSVQDPAAQLAAPLLDLAPGQRVLDACAAPGGKTTQILESETRLASLVAIDNDASRLARLEENLARSRLTATVVHDDATDPHRWWDTRHFDRILIDAPCTATGIIRRHPEIKLLRRRADIAALQALQDRLLRALWPLLAPGGRLVYCTCSVLPAENKQRIGAFLGEHPDANLLRISAGWGHDTGSGHQILPGEAEMDGFFYACLAKARTKKT